MNDAARIVTVIVFTIVAFPYPKKNVEISALNALEDCSIGHI